MNFSLNSDQERPNAAGRIAFFLLAVLALIIAFATFAEREHGTNYAMAHFYHSWWILALWGSVAIFGIMGLLTKKRSGRIWLLHLSLLTILAGAGITHFTGKAGRLHLRTDHPTRLYADGEHKGRVGHLPFEVTLKSFYAQNDNFACALNIKGMTYFIGLNRPLMENDVQLTLLSYDPDQQGVHLNVNIDPYGRRTTFIGYLLLCTTIFMLLPVKSFAFIICIFLFHLLGSLFYLKFLPPILQSNYFTIHVSFVTLGYLALFITFGCAVYYIFSSSEASTRHSRKFLHYGVYLLAIGIFTGAFWGNIAWGRYWAWDAKETWALITLIAYLIPLHTESLPFFKKEAAYHIYVAAAFLVLLMTFVGVNFLFTGLHSYL